MNYNDQIKLAIEYVKNATGLINHSRYPGITYSCEGVVVAILPNRKNESVRISIKVNDATLLDNTYACFGGDAEQNIRFEHDYSYFLKTLVRRYEECLRPSFTHLCKEAYATAVDRGWHSAPRDFGTLIALMQDEVSEAYEEMESEGELAEELADVLIRIYDLCGKYDYDLDAFLPVETFEKLVNSSIPLEGRNDEQILLNLHRKVSLVLRAYRKSQPIEPTLAEVVIEVAKIAHMCELDVAGAVKDKMEKNKKRPYRHGGKLI
jgi:NTP pyrophosphatase (non-canonical NTP hydrolase)